MQRRGGLARIDRNGKVYTFKNKLKVFTTGQLSASLIGLRDASTFYGFCQKHNGIIFEPIDNRDLEANQEHAFLLGYRVLCIELYEKRAQNEFTRYLKANLDRGKGYETQTVIQNDLSDQDLGASAGLNDLEADKKIYDEVLLSKNYSQTKFYIIRFSNAPDLLSAGGHTPTFDFKGNRLQNLNNIEKKMDGVSFNLIATDNASAAVFSWLGENEAAQKLVESLDEQSDDQLPHSIVRFVFENAGNTYFSPSWWEGLSDKDREALKNRSRVAANPIYPIRPDCLLDEGVRAVSWDVISRETNII